MSRDLLVHLFGDDDRLDLTWTVPPNVAWSPVKNNGCPTQAWVMMKMAGRQMASMPSFGTKARKGQDMALFSHSLLVLSA